MAVAVVSIGVALSRLLLLRMLVAVVDGPISEWMDKRM